MATRTCPFVGCDWSKEYDDERYSSTLHADMASETHYEREHGFDIVEQPPLRYNGGEWVSASELWSGSV